MVKTWLLTFFAFNQLFSNINGGANNAHTFDGGGMVDFIGNDFFFEILEPKVLRYTYKIKPAKDFGPTFNSSFYAQGVKLVPVDPPNGCGWPKNAADLEGSVALAERGECSFLSKAVTAERAGAIAIVICDYDPEEESFYIEMIDDTTGRDTSIPAGFLLGKNGNFIRKGLEKLGKNYALINIPANLTNVPLNKMNQPPWVLW
ncbi:PRADC1-like protein [Neocloeon triangulifer]|uniref:PRADC1-like protein n=1 Tax=Neocloeon triangulifer TaxID=2078957 RepID=UPI00286F81C1|nr:PRADC1-like protein [Neocloeon triangulifer]